MTPNNIPPGKITFHISSDGQQFKYVDGYFDVIDNPAVKRITPAALHWSGKETVRIIGGNLQDLGDIKIKFTYPDNGEGIIVDGRSVKSVIEFISPEFPKCGDWYYSLSLDGVRYITSLLIPVYGKIVIHDIQPRLGTIKGDTPVTINGSGIANSGTAMVRLTLIDNDNNVFEPLIVSGKYDNGDIKFVTPRFQSFGKAKVEVSLNNRDWNCIYQNRNGDTDIIYFNVYLQPQIKSLKITGEYRDILKIIGVNFYSSGTVIVRLRPLDGDRRNEKIEINGRIINPSVIECKTPSLFTNMCVVEISLDGKHFTRDKQGIEFKVLPIITEITPSWGHLSGGTLLTLKGVNFENTGKIVISFFSEWGGDRRVLGVYTEDGTIQCSTPSFIDCEKLRHNKDKSVKIDICLLGGSTFKKLPLLYPLKVFHYYDKPPVIWAVKPKDGPVYGNFSLFMETQQLHNTKELLVRLKHEISGETFHIRPKFKKGGSLSLTVPCWEYSGDGKVTVEVTYNGQEYSEINSRSQFILWVTYQNRINAAKNQSNQTKDFENPLDIAGGTAEKYISLKVQKENIETDLTLKPPSRIWKVKSSPFALPTSETINSDLFINEKKKELLQKTNEAFSKESKNPLWLNKGSYFTQYDSPFEVEEPPVHEQIYHPGESEKTELDEDILRIISNNNESEQLQTSNNNSRRTSYILSPYPLTKEQEELRESFHRSLINTPASQQNIRQSTTKLRANTAISTANNTLSTLHSSSTSSLPSRAKSVPPQSFNGDRRKSENNRYDTPYRAKTVMGIIPTNNNNNNSSSSIYTSSHIQEKIKTPIKNRIRYDNSHKCPYKSELARHLHKLFSDGKDGNDTQICFLRVFQTFDQNWDNTLDYRSFCMALRKLLPDISESNLNECWHEAVPREKNEIYYPEFINRLCRT